MSDKARMLFAFASALSVENRWYGVAVMAGLAALAPWKDDS